MQFEIVLTFKAKNHTQQAYDHYESVQSNLGERFLSLLELHYEKLSKNPQHYSYFSVDQQLQSLSLPIFPYSIIFQIISNRVLVIDVHNTHQNPDKFLKEI